MRNRLQQGSELNLHELNTENHYRVRINKSLGSGAVCIAYLAEDCSNAGLHYIVKECCPVKGASRDYNATVIWNDTESRNTYLSRFRRAYEMQISLQNNADTSNDLAHITHGLLEANDTLYMLIDPRAAISYDDLPREPVLQDIFRTARALSEAVGAQHRAGYLNLDIKPSNAMVVPGRPDSVLLLDFDSLVDKRSVSSTPSSYSPDFAAPEQLQRKLKKISEATDVYAIGAVVFERIVGRVPSAEDRSIFSDWDLDDNPLFAKLSSKTKRLTKELFHKTLAASPKSRLQDTAALSKLLENLIVESDPARRHLVSTFSSPTNIFVGREKELDDINKAFSFGEKLVFLTGMGGIGKTELAKNYAKRYRADFDVICFGEYVDSIENLFNDDDFIQVENDTEGTVSIRSVKELLDEHVLLIIDNYSVDPDAPADKDLDRLLSCKCSILITTRFRPEHLYGSAKVIDLSEKPLSDEEQILLFEKEYGQGFTVDQKPTVKRILSQIKGYTLLIPLIAKQIARADLSFESVLDRVTSAGVTDVSDVRLYHRKDGSIYLASLKNILKSVLDMSNLPERERFVLDCFSVLKGFTVKRATIIRWIGKEYVDNLNNLIDWHWLLCTGPGKDAKISVHDVVWDVLKSDTGHKIDTSWIKKPVQEFVDEIDFVSRNMQIQFIYTYLVPNTLHYLTTYGYMNQIIYQKKNRLIFTLLNALDPVADSEFIIQSYADITLLILERTYNFTYRGKNVLQKIKERESANRFLGRGERFYLDLLLFLFSLSDLCFHGYDENNERTAEYVEKATDETLYYAQNALLDLEAFNKDNSFTLQYRGYIYEAFLQAGAERGITLFDTKRPEFSKSARDSFGSFFERLTADLKERYSEYFIERNIEGQKMYRNPEIWFYLYNIFSDHITDDSLERDQKKFDEQDAFFWQDIQSGMTDADKQAEQMQNEAEALIQECEALGYDVHFKKRFSEEEKAKLFDPVNLAKGKELLDRALELYKQSNKMTEEQNASLPWLLYGSNYPDHCLWPRVACLHACCSGDFEKAVLYYDEYIKHREDVFFDKDISKNGLLQALLDLGFEEVSHEVIKLELARLIKDGNFSDDPEWLMFYIDYIIQYAEALGESETVEKYTALKQKYTDTGFTIE